MKHTITINGIVCEYNTREELADIMAVISAGASAPAQEAPKSTRKSGKATKGKGKAEPKADEPKLRLDREGAVKLMNTAWQNRAAAAWDRRVNNGSGQVKFADIDARKVSKADIEAGKKSLLASKKWASAVERHGLTEADLTAFKK